MLSHVMRKDYEGLNFGSGQSGRLDRQVPVTEKCASWIVQAQLLQRPFYVVDGAAACQVFGLTDGRERFLLFGQLLR